MRFRVIFLILLLWMAVVFVPGTESCLPSWFRKTRSAEAEALQGKPEETNEIGEDPDLLTTTTVVPTSEYVNSDGKKNSTSDEELEEAMKNVVEIEAEYIEEYDDLREEEESDDKPKYNENATKKPTSTMTPEVRREIEKKTKEICKDYCHNNATCHVEGDTVANLVRYCHCPPGWEGRQCDRRYVQDFYAVSRYNDGSKVGKPKVVHKITETSSPPNQPEITILADIRHFIMQSPTSAVPAFAFLIVMLLMFVAIVAYAYRRMSSRIDDTTYTMSHMCPPEAFTVLKTPNGRKISVHHDTLFVATSSSASSSIVPQSIQRVPGRTHVVKMKSNDICKNNFLTILRNQGTIPSRNINEDDTPKHYKSVPRVEVSAINYSGHIDFSTLSFSSDDPSQDHKNGGPAAPHVAIEMENWDATTSRSNSRAAGEPSTPTTSEPMIFKTK